MKALARAACVVVAQRNETGWQILADALGPKVSSPRYSADIVMAELLAGLAPTWPADPYMTGLHLLMATL
jgi:hypothetical protein